MFSRVLLIGSFLALCCSSFTSAANGATYNLKDYGATGDGVTDDGPALQAALNALAGAGGGTLFVPAGSYAIVTPVSKDFSGVADSITFAGVPSSTVVDSTGTGTDLTKSLGLVSEFFPRTGTQTAIQITGLQNLTVADLAFVGTPNVTTDAKVTVYIDQIEKALIRHCEFYGLSTLVANGGIITSVRSRLKIEQTKFLGSTATSGYGTSIVQNFQWKAFEISDTVFADYGQRPGLYGKLGYGGPYAWINIGQADTVLNTSPRREAIVRDVFLDEGGFIGIISNPGQYEPPPSAPIDLIYITGLRMNVSNLGTSGNYFSKTQAVLIEKSRYQWSHNADAAVNLLNVKTAILDDLECVDHAYRIRANGGTGTLSVINSIYTFLDSAAQTTNVINTADEDDPVQYVRERYDSVLDTEPDAAGHFYWSNLILRCGEDSQCIADKQGQLNAYLATSPSPNFSITGRVTDENGAALSNIVLKLSGSQAVTTQTDGSGQYKFSNLPTSGIYTVAVLDTQHTYAPAERTLTTPATDQTLNFQAVVNAFAVSGKITSNGAALSGVTIAYSGPETGITTTNVNGIYNFALTKKGTYTITPSKTHYTFAPQSLTANLTGPTTADFTGNLNQHTIAGRVANTNNYPISGVTVTLSGTENATATTNAQGTFAFTNLDAGGNYVVTPSLAHYTVNPSSKAFNDLSANQSTNFVLTLARHKVSGRVTKADGSPVSGVTVKLSGTQGGTTTTTANGDYSFSDLPSDGDYTVTLTKPDYFFTPSSKTFVDLGADQIADFTAQLAPVLISKPNSTRALAFDSVLQTEEPFALGYVYPWSPDRRARVELFVANLELAPGDGIQDLSVELEDASHRIYVLNVEYLGEIPECSGVSRVVVRLSNDLGNAGDVLTKIIYRGISSNRVRLGIGHIGGGLPDDPGSLPTPGPPFP